MKFKIDVAVILTLIVVCLMALSESVKADSIRLPDGTMCQFDSDDSSHELEFYAQNKDVTSHNSYDTRDEVEVGMKFKIKLGVPDRLDCNKLYGYALQTKELELRQMKEKLKKLEAMNSSQNLNW